MFDKKKKDKGQQELAPPGTQQTPPAPAAQTAQHTQPPVNQATPHPAAPAAAPAAAAGQAAAPAAAAGQAAAPAAAAGQAAAIQAADKALMAQDAGQMSPYGDLTEGFTPEEIERLKKTTGAEDMPQDQRRPPLVKWNLDTRDENGKRVNPNVFYNCQTGEMSEYILFAILMVKRGREEAVHVNGKKETYCRSYDCQVGVDDRGVLHDCDSCPRRKGKRGERKACTPTIRVIAYDLERNFPFVFDVMRSSFVPFSSHLEKNFYSKWKVGATAIDIPLYMLATRMTLREEEGQGKIYYVPAFSIDGKIENKETVLALNHMAEHIAKMKKELQVDDSKSPKSQAAEQDAPQDDEPPPPSDDDIPF